MIDKQKSWTDRILEWEKSGLSQKEFCRQKEISFSTFHYWRKKLKTKAGQFVEIKVDKAGKNNQAIVITLPNNIQIHIQHVSDSKMIGELVQSLKDLT